MVKQPLVGIVRSQEVFIQPQLSFPFRRHSGSSVPKFTCATAINWRLHPRTAAARWGAWTCWFWPSPRNLYLVTLKRRSGFIHSAAVSHEVVASRDLKGLRRPGPWAFQPAGCYYICLFLPAGVDQIVLTHPHHPSNGRYAGPELDRPRSTPRWREIRPPTGWVAAESNYAALRPNRAKWMRMAERGRRWALGFPPGRRQPVAGLLAAAWLARATSRQRMASVARLGLASEKALQLANLRPGRHTFLLCCRASLGTPAYSWAE